MKIPKHIKTPKNKLAADTNTFSKALFVDAVADQMGADQDTALKATNAFITVLNESLNVNETVTLAGGLKLTCEAKLDANASDDMAAPFVK